MQQGLTQMALWQKIGVSQTSLSHLETGDHDGQAVNSEPALRAISQWLGVPLERLKALGLKPARRPFAQRSSSSGS